MKKYVKKFEDSKGDIIKGTEHQCGTDLIVTIYEYQTGTKVPVECSLEIDRKSGDVAWASYHEFTGEMIIVG